MKYKTKYKKREYLFVDGYNIINCWSDLQRVSEGSLEQSRNDLIDTMAEYRCYKGTEVVIVFDAHMVKGSSQKNEYIKGIEVVYTKESQTADQYIEKQVDEIGKVKKVTVATSDWVEQQVVLGRGATRVSARELKIEIGELKRGIDRKRKKDSQVNNMIMGRLDEDTLDKLINWGKTGK